jgi:hypothetical protein
MTLPAGIIIIFLMVTKKKLDSILLKYDSNYISMSNDYPIRKMIKAIKSHNLLTKSEKKLLLYSAIAAILSFTYIIFCLIYILFYTDYIF